MILVLSNIQDNICNCADTISGIMDTDVGIIGESLMYIADTEEYRHMPNENVAKNDCIYRHVLQMRETVLIKNSDEHSPCQLCEKHHYCPEMPDLNAPVFLSNHVIGTIGIICSTQVQRDTLLSQIDKSVTFIEQIAVMISSKVLRCLKRLYAQETLSAFRRLVDATNHSVVAIDDKGLIWHANRSADHIFSREVQGLLLTIEITGDSLYGDEEAWLTLEGQKYHVLCKRVPLSSQDNGYLTIIIFCDTHDYLSNLTPSLYESDIRVRLIGHSPSMKQLRGTTGKTVSSYVSALITGESGSGKGVVAFATHQSSPRKAAPFVTINYTATPEQLLESELFGYVHGTFNEANPRGRMGRFELANGNSLLLDETGDMPLHLQAEPFRVLWEKAITRVGSNNTINIDVRIIATTNKNTNVMVENNQFREDPFYRLSIVPLVLPSLCERRADTVVLARYFADELSVSY